MAELVVFHCGMPSEQKIIKAAFPDNVVLSGTDKFNLPDLVPAGTTRLVSIGLCGGLYGSLKVAGVALASFLVDGQGNKWPCDRTWNVRLLRLAKIATDPVASPTNPDSYDTVPAAWAAGVRTCPWYSSGVMDQGDTVPQRQALFAATGAMAIDDESIYSAKEAKRRGIAFNIARPLSDDASETLPFALRGRIMNANGSANLPYFLSQIATEPLWQTLQIPKIIMDYNASLAALRALTQAMSGSPTFHNS